MGRVSTFVTATGALLRRNVGRARRDVGLALGAPILLAVFIVVLFDGVYGAIARAPGWPTDEFIDWVAPGGVLLAVFVGAGYAASGVLRDIDSGFLDRLRLLPVPAASIIGATLLFEVVRAALAATAVLGVSVLLGADLGGGVLGSAAAVGCAAALAVAWNGLFVAVALRTRSHEAVIGLQPAFMPIIMISTFWVPFSFMPGWYETAASWNPFTPLLDGTRSLLAGDPEPGDLLVGLLVVAVIGVVTVHSSIRMLSTAMDPREAA